MHIWVPCHLFINPIFFLYIERLRQYGAVYPPLVCRSVGSIVSCQDPLRLRNPCTMFMSMPLLDNVICSLGADHKRKWVLVNVKSMLWFKCTPFFVIISILRCTYNSFQHGVMPLLQWLSKRLFTLLFVTLLHSHANIVLV